MKRSSALPSRCLAATAIVLLATQARAGEITVTVLGVRNDHGTIALGVCPKPLFLTENCPYTARVPAHAGSVTLRIAGVPPGVYALQAYQDENGNGRLDRNFLGIPTEAVALSRDPKPGLGPPAFADSALSIGTGDAAVTMALRY